MIIGAPFGFFGSSYIFNYTISVNTTNFSVRTVALAAGWDGIKPLLAYITINSGIYVYGTTALGLAYTAFSTGVMPIGSFITVTNAGYIMGGGGSAYLIDSTAMSGADAIYMQCNGSITSSAGQVLGGGGAGASVSSSVIITSYGGGGAGGGYSNGVPQAQGGAVGATGQNGVYYAPGLIYGGGGGGRKIIGVGGDTGNTVPINPGLGGDGGGAGAAYTSTGSGGFISAVGGAGIGNGDSGGGGGWGYAGGSGKDYTGATWNGGSAGYAVRKNGYTVTTSGIGYHGTVG